MKDSLKADIGRLIKNAQQWSASDIRSDLFDRYMGEPYGDEVQGRSQFVSTDVADAVEAILPDIMDVFTSSEGLIEFQPVGPEDEEAARQETGIVEHIFWQKNNGFEILYTWFKEALIQQNSYVQRGWVEKRRIEIEEYEDLTPDELLTILSDKGDYEILESDGGGDEPIRIKLRCTARDKRYEVTCFPQEEFFGTPRWNKVSLEGIPCCGRRREMERGELRAMGFSKASIAKAFEESDEDQTEDRFSTRDNQEFEEEHGDESTEKVTVYQAFVRADVNNDGFSELLQVWAYGDGSQILEWDGGKEAIDEVSCIPISSLTPYIVPHRHIGRSVAEIVDDIQKVKTVLLRHTLDNIYLTNYARPHFDENMAGENTFTDLANPAPGAPVRTGGAEVIYNMPPSVIGTTLPLLEKFDDLKETRTGATRYNQGLDADSLNKTATGIEQIMNASQKKTLLIARTFAETGLRDLFMGIHRDLRSGPMKELAVKLNGKWVSVNPRTWKDRTDMNVAIGNNSREQRRNGMMLLGQVQRELMTAGSRMVNEKKVYNLTARMMETFGFKSIAEFMDDPDMLPPPQPQQPGLQEQLAMKQTQIMEFEAQSRAANDKMKIEADHQFRMAELALKHQEAQRKEAETASRMMTEQETLDLKRKEVVMKDDLARDQLAKETESAVDYGKV